LGLYYSNGLGVPGDPRYRSDRTRSGVAAAALVDLNSGVPDRAILSPALSWTLHPPVWLKHFGVARVTQSILGHRLTSLDISSLRGPPGLWVVPLFWLMFGIRVQGQLGTRLAES
jgi:hypothetical protein